MDLIFLGSVAIFAIIYIAAMWIWIKEDKKENLYKTSLEKQLSQKEEMVQGETVVKKKSEERLAEKEKEFNELIKNQDALKEELVKKEEIITKEVASKENFQEKFKSSQEKNEQLTQELTSREGLYRELLEKYEALKAKPVEEPKQESPQGANDAGSAEEERSPEPEQ